MQPSWEIRSAWRLVMARSEGGGLTSEIAFDGLEPLFAPAY